METIRSQSIYAARSSEPNAPTFVLQCVVYLPLRQRHRQSEVREVATGGNQEIAIAGLANSENFIAGETLLGGVYAIAVSAKFDQTAGMVSHPDLAFAVLMDRERLVAWQSFCPAVTVRPENE